MRDLAMPRTSPRLENDRKGEDGTINKDHQHQTGFLDLPAELRNDIYRMCLGSRQSLDVWTMPHPDYEETVKSGSCPFRSAYAAPDLTGNIYPRVSGTPGRMMQPRYEITTYVVGGPTMSQKAAVLILLVLNRQVRHEAASILYGENIIRFTTVSSIVPFFKDRSLETRSYITDIELHLTIEEESWRFPLSGEFDKAKFWSQSFAALARLPSLSLEKLCIVLDDYCIGYYEQGLNPHLHRRELKWLHHMSNISSLHLLGVQYVSQSFYDERPDLMVAGLADDELWVFLAPKMLKNVDGEDHNAMGLQHRRLSMPCLDTYHHSSVDYVTFNGVKKMTPSHSATDSTRTFWACSR